MRDTCLRGFGPVGTNGRQYAEREVDSDELMPHYLRHVSAMTTEGLHAKSAIAAELAWRDAKVAALQARIAELEARNAASERDAMQAGLFRRFVAFAKGRRAPTWMPQRFLDECRDVIEEKA